MYKKQNTIDVNAASKGIRFMPLSPENHVQNMEAGKTLIPGQLYIFEDEGVAATGFPTEGPAKLTAQDFTFKKGRYLGMNDKDRHIFMGFPHKDERKINEKRKLCFFHVDFIGGVQCRPENN